MSLFKQFLLSLLLLGVGVGGWYAYHNPQVLEPVRAQLSGMTGGESGATQAAEARPEAAGGGRGGGGQQAGRAGRLPGLRSGGATNVITASVAPDRSSDAVTALGTARAVRSITVIPQVSGVVREVAFAPGARVEEGAVLVRLEDDEQRVAVERARLVLEQAREALDRAQRLFETKTTTATALAEAETAAQMGEIELRTAEIAQSRREIRAPFAGIAGLTETSLGDFVTTTTEITSLDDLSTIIVAFEVPERWAGRIAAGTPIRATASALPGSAFKGKVTAVDSRVDETSRTLRMEAALGNDREDLKPGMSVTVQIAFEGEERLGVPSLAVQWDREGSFVWQVEGDTVRRAPVTILSRRSDAVIVMGDLQAGDDVVVEGVQRLRDGAKVTRVGETPAREPAAVPKPAAAQVPEREPGEGATAGRSPDVGSAGPPPTAEPEQGDGAGPEESPAVSNAEPPTPEPRPENGSAPEDSPAAAGGEQPRQARS